MSIAPASSAAPETQLVLEKKPQARESSARSINGNDEAVTANAADSDLSFSDLLDVINPLHHIPILGSIYRAISGDTIKPAAQVIGGGLFGGPLGAMVATIEVAHEQETGKDFGGAILALLNGAPEDKTAERTLVADIANDTLDPAADETGNIAALPPANINTEDMPEAGTAIDISVAPKAPETAKEDRIYINSLPWLKPEIVNPEKAAPRESVVTAPAPAPVPPQAMPGKMMEALEKYQALIKSREAVSAPSGATY